ncbi:uncharacterized protein PAE49_022581 isoform 2-T2 [Odontesthes bonariensis]|uniref:uncharacterized protein LOC142370268 isoform X2 n=1 Tax=Odontesthes bonariensis TaxID=219752 RepID=UPI003F5850F6
MSHNKISLFIFGNGRSLKKALISNILGKDISVLSRRNILKNTCSYEDDTHQFICTPDLNVESEDMRELFSMNPHPDMCLLVVERGSSPEDVRRQIDHLKEKTRKPANDFRVVLPPGHTTTQFYPIKTYTFDKLMKKLKELKSARMRPSSFEGYTSCFGHKQPHTGSQPHTWSHSNTNQKISVIILGNGEYLKQNLISFITGKDISAMSKKENVKNPKRFENDMYEFTYTTESKEGDDEIREMFSENPNPDMCLVPVKEGFDPEEVWNQIDNMCKTTGKPTEEFIVVLPQGQTDNCYPFKSYTREELLRKLDEYRQLEANNKKSDDLPESQTAEETDKEVTGEPAVNLVLLGMAGTGKSACGNTILMDNRFTSRVSSKPVTTECQMAEKQINGINVRVIDTPDIFDDDIESSVKKENVKKCKQLCESGPCVYLLVMHVSRFTEGKRDILTKLERAFGSRVKEQTIIVFTRGDDLHRAGMSLESFLGTFPPNLKNIVDKCGRRCVLFENSSSHSGQVDMLMAQVKSMLKQ